MMLAAPAGGDHLGAAFVRPDNLHQGGLADNRQRRLDAFAFQIVRPAKGAALVSRSELEPSTEQR